MNSFARIGIIGLSITVVVNLAGFLVFHRASSVFFSDAWWSAWFPVYLVWMVFAIGGFASRNPSKADRNL
jgi:hypothetical protein